MTLRRGNRCLTIELQALNTRFQYAEQDATAACNNENFVLVVGADIGVLAENLVIG